ncbi:MAG: Nif3-like dinuclear metal center hexameric protein [Oscillospiraceae bacterium]|nr:Nif3-like dinuclear metal center hexameric protein [Oscillospiraceae bacterium]
MATVKDIFNNLNDWAPVETKMDFDNVGHLVGFENAEVTRILTALDITDEVIDEAAEAGAQLIVSHHPMFFGLKNVVDSDIKGRKIIKLIQNNMSAICMHTNLDAAEGGVNTLLASACGITEPAKLYDEPNSIGCYGEIGEETDFFDYLKTVKHALGTSTLRYVYAGKPVKKVAVLGGSGGDDMMRAIELGCDTYVTADLKYHKFLDAKEYGLNLIDGDHFCTENLVVPAIKLRINEYFPEIQVIISQRHRQTVQFF